MQFKLDLKQFFILIFVYMLTLFPGAVNAQNIGGLFNTAFQVTQFLLIYLFYKQFESEKINISVDKRIITGFIVSIFFIVITSWDEVTRSLNGDEIFYARLINQHALIGLEKINFLGQPKVVMLIITFVTALLYITIFKFCYKRRIFFILFLSACLITKIISSNLFSFSLLHQIGWGAFTSVTQLIFLGENISYRIDKIIVFLLGVYFLVFAYTPKEKIKPFLFTILGVLSFYHPLIKHSVLTNEASVFTFLIICVVMAAEKFKIDLNNLILIVLCGVCLRLNCIFILPIVFVKMLGEEKRISYKYCLLCLAVSVPRFLEVYFFTNVKGDSSFIANFGPGITCFYNNLGVFGILTIILALLFLIRNKGHYLIAIPVLFTGTTFLISEKLVIAPRYIFEFSVPFIMLGVIVLCTLNIKYKAVNCIIATGLVFFVYYETNEYKSDLPAFTSEYLLNRENYVEQKYVTRDPFEYDRPIKNAEKTPLIVGYDYGAFSLVLNNIPFGKYLETKEHYNKINNIYTRGDSEELLAYLKEKKDFSLIIAEIGGQKLAEALEDEQWEIKENYISKNWGSKTYLLEHK